jgi:hypothetical protein
MALLQHPEKVGIFAEPQGDRNLLNSTPKAILEGIDALGFRWYYTYANGLEPWDVGTSYGKPTYDNRGTLVDPGYTPNIVQYGAIWNANPLYQNSTTMGLAQSLGRLIITYNEPWNTFNHYWTGHPMTPAEALAGWPALQALGPRLASPSVSFVNYTGSNDWLAEFMAGVASNGYRVDAINVHFYSITGSVDEMRSYLEAMHNTYNKPLVVSEWAMANFGAGTGFSQQQNADFAVGACQMMDQLPYVEAHCWYHAVEGTGFTWYGTAVLNADGTPNIIGNAFKSMLVAPTVTAPNNLSNLLAQRAIRVGLSTTGSIGTLPGGTTTNVSGGGLGFTFDTMAQAKGVSVPSGASGPLWIKTLGYNNVADRGGDTYQRVISAPTAHTAWFQSADGAYWEKMYTGEDLRIEQFGAIEMHLWSTMPSVGADDDSYPAFLAADKYIDAKSLGGVTLKLGPGLWYLSRAVNLRRRPYIIKGHIGAGGGANTTIIRTAPYIDAFVINYHWGTGHDLVQTIGNFQYRKGIGVWKQTGQPFEGHVYRCTYPVDNFGERSGTGDPLTGTDPTVEITWGDCKFKWEAYIGPPTSQFPDAPDYSIVGDGQQADNMVIQDLLIYSFWDPRSPLNDRNKWPNQVPDASGTPQYFCGVLGRARCSVRNVWAFACQSFGVAFAADGGHLLTGPGNVNGWHADHIVAYYNGYAGLCADGSDANAGVCTYLDTIQNGYAGLLEYSFLGNNYFSFQSAYDGLSQALRQYPTTVRYNGYYWLSRQWTNGVETSPAYTNEEPGGPTANNAWVLYGGDGTPGVAANVTGSIAGTTLTVTAFTAGTQASLAVGYMISGTSVRPGTKITSGSGTTGSFGLSGAAQTVSSRAIRVMEMSNDGTTSNGGDFADWNATQTYHPGGAWLTLDFNAWNAYFGMYIEGATPPAQICNRDVVWGGPCNPVERSRGGLVYSNSEGGMSPYSINNQWNSPTGTLRTLQFMGGGGPNPNFLGWFDVDSGQWSLGLAGPADGHNQDFALQDVTTGGGANTTPTFLVSGRSTLQQFGRGAGQYGVTYVNKLAIGRGAGPGDPVDGLIILTSNGTPATGTFRVGEIRINVATGTGIPWAWQWNGTAWSSLGNRT